MATDTPRSGANHSFNNAADTVGTTVSPQREYRPFENREIPDTITNEDLRKRLRDTQVRLDSGYLALTKAQSDESNHVVIFYAKQFQIEERLVQISELRERCEKGGIWAWITGRLKADREELVHLENCFRAAKKGYDIEVGKKTSQHERELERFIAHNEQGWATALTRSGELQKNWEKAKNAPRSPTKTQPAEESPGPVHQRERELPTGRTRGMDFER